MRLVGLTLALVVAGGQACTFLEGADQHISLMFKRNRVGHIRKLTDLDFKVQPMDAIVTNECRDQLVVVRESEGGEYNGEAGWERVDRDFRLRSRNNNPYYLWEVAGVVPCRRHTVRLYLGENFIETSLEAATTEQMAEFQFNPGMVSNIHMEGDELVWEGSECATSFTVAVLDVEGEMVGDEETTTSRRLALSSLNACTDYDFEIVPWIDDYMAEDDSETAEAVTTLPSAETLSSLTLDIQPNEDQVTVSWGVPAQISCVDLFEVSVCNVRTGECQQSVVEDEDGAATTTFEGLPLSSEFDVSVYSQKHTSDFGSTSSNFFSKVDLDAIVFTASENEDGSSVKLSWSDVVIATQFVVYRRQAGGERERLVSFTREKLEKEDDLFVFYDSEVERCQELQYGLVVVVEGQEYSMLESDSVILPLDETEHFDTPIDVEVEATSMSVSFTGSPCIPAYLFSLYLPGEVRSQESEEPATTFSDLEPCSSYALEVTPLMGEERRRWLTAVHHEFVTKEELRAPPQESLMVGEWSSLTGQLHVSWEKTSCADAFEIRLLGEDGEERTEPYRTGSSDENFLMLGNGGEMEVKGCTNYSLEVSTISQGGERSSGSASSPLTLGPIKDSLFAQGVTELEFGSRNLSLWVSLTEDTACMDEVRLSLCKHGEECQEEELDKVEEEGEDQYPAFYFEKDDLAPGQGYELVLSFLHAGEEVGEIRQPFTTSLDLSQMEPMAVHVNWDEVHVFWSEVEGADHYLVYRQYQGEEPEESIVTNVSEPEATEAEVYDQRPCSTATYLVEAVREGLDEQPRIASNAVTVLPNNTAAYKAEQLRVETEGREDVQLEWKHLPCIASYYVTFTSLQDGRELTEEVSEIENDAVSVNTKKLDECQQYDITIVPRFLDGSVWEAEPEVQESVRIKGEDECKEIKRRQAMKLSAKSARPVRRRSSAGHHQTSSISLLLAMLLLAGLRC